MWKDNNTKSQFSKSKFELTRGDYMFIGGEVQIKFFVKNRMIYLLS